MEGLTTAGISLIRDKLVDGWGDVGGQLLLLDLKLLLLLHLHKLRLLLLRHNCRSRRRSHHHSIINPAAVCMFAFPITTGIKIEHGQDQN